ncbi:MAG: preprotein translocase subunit SecG [bacterium]
MFTLLLVLHVFVAITLVMVVILQSGRGAELGAAFGGMGQATYGATKSTFISKFTTGLAIVFMSTSLSLAFLTTDRSQSSLLKSRADPAAQSAPAAQTAPAKTGEAAKTSTSPAPAPAAPAKQ